jgi:hypothetical protein
MSSVESAPARCERPGRGNGKVAFPMRSDDTTPIPTKRCSKCGAVLPATTEFFYANSRALGGLAYRCRECSRSVSLEYYREHRRIRIEAMEARRRMAGIVPRCDRTVGLAEKLVCTGCGLTLPVANFRVRRREHSDLTYRSRCILCESKQNAEYRTKHPEVFARYRVEHGEDRRAYDRAYHAEHRAEDAERGRRWLAANHDKAAVKARARRARECAVSGTHTTADVAAQRTRQHGLCYWCHEKTGRHYHVDHVIPLSHPEWGATNGPENLVIACAWCNRSKGAKHPMEWAGRLC